jgi:hypothetical protein
MDELRPPGQENYYEGFQIQATEIMRDLFPSPGGILVKRVLEQMATIPVFLKLFGTFQAFDSDQQRWACYPRQDWSLRQLPAIMIYEGNAEDKTSDNAWLNGSLRIMVLWPAGQRRSDWEKVGVAFKGAMQNFFASKYTEELLDRYRTLNLEKKVPGLNLLGKEMTWTPNVNGILEGEAVPATILDVKYRFDLRRWYDYLEEIGYSKADPFKKTIHPLVDFFGRVTTEKCSETSASVEALIPILPGKKEGS